MERLSGLGSTLLGWLCLGYACVHFFLWTLPRTAWLYYTGRMPSFQPPAPSFFEGRALPGRLRERGWCVACARLLAPGAVRCPDHPQGEVIERERDER